MRIYGQKPLFGAFVRKTEVEASKIGYARIMV